MSLTAILHPRVPAREPDRDRAPAGRELDAVGRQVPHDLLDAAGVAPEGAGVGVELGVDVDALGLGHGRDRVDRRLDRLQHLDLPGVEPERAAVDARHVEENRR